MDGVLVVEKGQRMAVYKARTEGEHYAYQRGVADGNASATGVLVGCKHRLRLVVDPDLPEGHCELRVSSLDHIHAPSIYLDMVLGDGE